MSNCDCTINPNPAPLGSLITIDLSSDNLPPPVDGLSWTATNPLQGVVLRNGPITIPPLSVKNCSGPVICQPLEVTPPFSKEEQALLEPDIGPQPYYEFSYLTLVAGLLVILLLINGYYLLTNTRKTTIIKKRNLFDDIHSFKLQSGLSPKEQKAQFIEFFALIRAYLSERAQIGEEQPSVGLISSWYKNQVLTDLLRHGEYLAYSSYQAEAGEYEKIFHDLIEFIDQL